MADLPQASQPVSADAFAARMYDHDNKTWIDVPANQVGDYVRSGKYTFESGIQIPVTTARGETGSVLSDNAYNEFTHNGMSWLTPQAQQASDEKAQAKIQQDSFGGSPVTAAALGVADIGSLGLSSVALKAGGLGDAAKATAEANSVAYGAGQVAGAFLPDSLASGAAKGLGLAAEGAVKAGVGAAGAEGAIATKILPSIAKEAAQGAVYGAGSGVSEQALGSPDSVVDSMVSHVGTGALFGGSLGAVFGGADVARPYMDTMVEKSLQGGKSMVDRLATSSAAKGIVASMTNAGQAEAGKALGTAMQNPEFMELVSRLGINAGKDMLEQTQGTLRTAEGLERGLTQDIKSELKNASTNVQENVAATMKGAGNDLVQAAEDAHNVYKTASNNFETVISGLKDPVTYDTAPMMDRFESAIDKLGDGSPYAKNVAKKIEATMAVADLSTQGSEASFLSNIRNKLDNISHDTLTAHESRIVRSLVDEADQSLLTSPNLAISHGYQAVKSAEEVADHLRNIGDRTALKITKAPLPGERVADAGYEGASRVVNEQKMLRTLSDPQTRQLVTGVFQSLDQLSPEIRSLGQGVKTVEEKIALQNLLEMKISKILPKAHVDGAAVTDVLDMLGNPKELAEKLDKVQQVQQALSQDASPLQRILATKQILGEPIDKDLMLVAKHEQAFDLLRQYKDARVKSFDPIQAAKGAAIAGPKGVLLGFKESNVGDRFTVLARLQQDMQRGAAKMETAIKTTVSALTSPASKQLARGVTYRENSSITDQRKAYPKIQQQLQAYQPSSSTLEQYAPKIASAIAQKQQKTVTFLQSKLPDDPFKENSISLNKTGYVPSDHDLSSFNRYIQAASNPLHVLEDLKQNKASPEAIETLKTLHPDVYQKLQNAVLDGIITSKEDLSYQQKIQLSTVFDIPTDYTLRPDFISRMQQAVSADPGGRPSGPTNKRTIKLDLKPEESVATQAQRTTYDMNH